MCATCSAVARAASGVAATMFRCPILRPCFGRALPYACCAPGKASTSFHGGVRLRALGEPQIAQQVEHHRGAVLARRPKGRPAMNAYLQAKLRQVAGVLAVVAALLCGRRAISFTTRLPSCSTKTPHLPARPRNSSPCAIVQLLPLDWQGAGGLFYSTINW